LGATLSRQVAPARILEQLPFFRALLGWVVLFPILDEAAPSMHGRVFLIFDQDFLQRRLGRRRLQQFLVVCLCQRTMPTFSVRRLPLATFSHAGLQRKREASEVIPPSAPRIAGGHDPIS
jgi:hypothetical protein